MTYTLYNDTPRDSIICELGLSNTLHLAMAFDRKSIQNLYIETHILRFKDAP